MVFPRWVAAAAVGLAVALLILDIFITKARLEIRREIPIRSELGKPAGVALFIINKSPFPLKITAEDCPPDIVNQEPRRFFGKVPAAGEIRFDYSIVPMRRGTFDFGETYIRYICRLGLVRKKSSSLNRTPYACSRTSTISGNSNCTAARRTS